MSMAKGGVLSQERDFRRARAADAEEGRTYSFTIVEPSRCYGAIAKTFAVRVRICRATALFVDSCVP